MRRININKVMAAVQKQIKAQEEFHKMILLVVFKIRDCRDAKMKQVTKLLANRINKESHEISARWYLKYDWSRTLEISYMSQVLGESRTYSFDFNAQDCKDGNWKHVEEQVSACIKKDYAAELKEQLHIIPKLVEAENNLRAVIQAARINAEAITSALGENCDRQHYRCGVAYEIGKHFPLMLEEKVDLSELCDGEDEEEESEDVE